MTRNLPIAAELTKSCCFLDAIFPAGHPCSIATEEEKQKFLAYQIDKTGTDTVLARGGAVVRLSGRLRLLENGYYKILSKTPN